MSPPIIDTIETLRLVHAGLAQKDEEVSKYATSVLSIVAFGLKHPRIKISEKQLKLVDNLKNMIHTC